MKRRSQPKKSRIGTYSKKEKANEKRPHAHTHKTIQQQRRK